MQRKQITNVAHPARRIKRMIIRLNNIPNGPVFRGINVRDIAARITKSVGHDPIAATSPYRVNGE